jgi:hypothetical protein
MKKVFSLGFFLVCVSSVLFSQNLTKVQPPCFDRPIEIDVGFVGHINFMGNCAKKHNLNIIVTGDGFRKEGASLTNTVVNPANASNHLVGHAIDINIMYNGTLYNSTALGNFSTLPQPVKDFITECKSNGMRWGGDFSQRDPVHFDSGLNVNNPTEWKRLYGIYQPQPQTSAAPTINFVGTWVGVDNSFSWVFSGSNYTLFENGVNCERGTFSVNANQTRFIQNGTHYWSNGTWVSYTGSGLVSDLTVLSNNRFRVTGNNGEPYDETYERR